MNIPARSPGAGLCRILALMLVFNSGFAADEPAAVPAAPGVESSVVKIFSTVRGPDQLRPWAKQSPRETSGSGVVIEGNRILTNAHVVSYASQIQVQGNQSGEKLVATVESISPTMDLAVLKLDD